LAGNSIFEDLCQELQIDVDQLDNLFTSREFAFRVLESKTVHIATNDQRLRVFIRILRSQHQENRATFRERIQHDIVSFGDHDMDHQDLLAVHSTLSQYGGACAALSNLRESISALQQALTIANRLSSLKGDPYGAEALRIELFSTALLYYPQVSDWRGVVACFAGLLTSNKITLPCLFYTLRCVLDVLPDFDPEAIQSTVAALCKRFLQQVERRLRRHFEAEAVGFEIVVHDLLLRCASLLQLAQLKEMACLTRSDMEGQCQHCGQVVCLQTELPEAVEKLMLKIASSPCLSLPNTRPIAKLALLRLCQSEALRTSYHGWETTLHEQWLAKREAALSQLATLDVQQALLIYIQFVVSPQVVEHLLATYTMLQTENADGSAASPAANDGQPRRDPSRDQDDLITALKKLRSDIDSLLAIETIDWEVADAVGRMNSVDKNISRSSKQQVVVCFAECVYQEIFERTGATGLGSRLVLYAG
jgi:hypothetical protein